MIHQADKIILDQTIAKPRLEVKPYIVTWRSYPLSFHTNVSQGRCYCVCREEEATRFTSESEARDRAGRHGLTWDHHCACEYLSWIPTPSFG